jgi:hypothetical protein
MIPKSFIYLSMDSSAGDIDPNSGGDKVPSLVVEVELGVLFLNQKGNN